jgi:hypothetical protein
MIAYEIGHLRKIQNEYLKILNFLLSYKINFKFIFKFKTDGCMT